MSPRTRAGGLAVLVSVLAVLAGAGPAEAELSPVFAGLSLQEGSPARTPTNEPHEHDHDQPSPTPSGGHDDHGTSPPDTVSTTTRTLVIGGFGALNAGVIAAAALVRRRQRRTRANATLGARR